jgi:hypothetical protein
LLIYENWKTLPLCKLSFTTWPNDVIIVKSYPPVRLSLSRVQRLYQLQTLDTEIDQSTQQLTDIAVQLGESEALRQVRAAAGAAEQALRTAQTTVQDLTLEVKSLADRIAGEEKKLYQGKALSAKEATNLQGEIASLKRRHNQREERLLEAMLEVEAAEARLKQARQDLTAIQTAWQTGQAQLNQVQSDLKAKLGELKAQRLGLIKSVDEEDLEEYDDLRRRKAGRAAALLKNGVCQGCGIAASSSKAQQARAGTELIYCGSCGRILYAP